MKKFILQLCLLFLSVALCAQGNINGVVINEILLDPSASSTPSGCTGSAADNSSDVDGDGDSEDDDEFVELYNITTIDVDISGWSLADDDGKSFTFPAGTIIAGEGYIVVMRNWDGPTSQPINVFSAGSNLGLNNVGETIYLTDGNTCVVVRVGGSARNNNNSPPTGCIAPFDADEDWGGDQDGSAVGRNPNGSANVVRGTCGTSTPNMINSPLPVELTHFTGKIIENKAQLQWTTASELENSHFEVEKSENGKVFKSIGRVEGNGTTLEEQAYYFEDFTPYPNLNYYRLKQVDFNGTFAYSEIIVLSSKITQKDVELYPNPSDGQFLQLDYSSNQSGRLNLEIKNLEGKTVFIQDFQIKQGINSIPIHLNTLAKGMYFLNLQQGKDVYRQKMVVQ